MTLVRQTDGRPFRAAVRISAGAKLASQATAAALAASEARGEISPGIVASNPAKVFATA